MKEQLKIEEGQRIKKIEYFDEEMEEELPKYDEDRIEIIP